MNEVEYYKAKLEPDSKEELERTINCYKSLFNERILIEPERKDFFERRLEIVNEVSKIAKTSKEFHKLIIEVIDKD